MSLLSEMKIVSDLSSVNFNTGTLFDLATGKYLLGSDGDWYLNGGLSSHINMFVGMSSQFKSTLMNSLVMRCMGVYNDPDVETVVKDSEMALAKDKERAMKMAEELYDDTMIKRIAWLDDVYYNLNNTDTFLKEICAKRAANKKKYTVETPFIDQYTGERMRVWKPFFVVIDSLTMLKADIEEDMLDNESGKGLGDPKLNTVHMVDGNKKSVFISAMRRRCQQYGIVLVLTGHYDTQIQMDPYSSMPKDTLFSKGNYKVKGCGSGTKFLSSIYAKCQASLLQDSNKEALYAEGPTQARDIYEVGLLLERCKTANAGEITPFVVSQSEGLLNVVTNYHYLRLHGYFGLNGNKQKQQCALLPDLTISRNTVRDLAKSNPQLRRALELTAQLCYVRTNWNVKDLPFDMDIEPAKLFDKLMSDKNKNLVSDILNTRGYWTYEKHPQPYMSLFKVLELAKAHLQ